MEASELAQPVCCPICREEVEKSQTIKVCKDEAHFFCPNCVELYITKKVEGGYMGICPTIYCPLEHSPGKQILAFTEWSKTSNIPTEVTVKYKKLADSTLAFLCGGCHSLRSLSVCAAPASHLQVEAAKAKIDSIIVECGREPGLFHEDIAYYSDGRLSVDAIYENVCSVHLPSLIAASDREAWQLFKHVLLLVEDPERQANLHLRHLRARPRIHTACCNREHCFRCKTKDFHEGKTCDENTATLDASIINCPGCGIAIAKGDGCNTVTCVCGKQFSWSSEKDYQERSNRFFEQYPSETARVCVQVLCRQHVDNASLFRDASAWHFRHRVEVNRELLRWWQARYPCCPSQACAVINSPLRSEGEVLAAEVWQASHAKEVKACKEENEKAIRSIFLTLYPSASDRATAAARLLDDKNFVDKTLKLRFSGLIASAQLWADENPQKVAEAIEAKESRSRAQFLFLYGDKCPEDFGASALLLPSPYEWNREASNPQLTFTNEKTTVTRVGSVSSYPAAFADLPAERCMITVRVDCAPRGPNWLTFGLVRRGFLLSGTDGVGRTADSWGINDDRSSSRDARITTCGRDLQSCRKFEAGDVLTAVVDTTEGWIEVSVNEIEVSLRMDIPPGPPSNYFFAMTFATDHSVTLISDSSQLRVSHAVAASASVVEGAKRTAAGDESGGAYDAATVRNASTSTSSDDSSRSNRDPNQVLLNREHSEMLVSLKRHLRRLMSAPTFSAAPNPREENSNSGSSSRTSSSISSTSSSGSSSSSSSEGNSSSGNGINGVRSSSAISGEATTASDSITSGETTNAEPLRQQLNGAAAATAAAAAAATAAAAESSNLSGKGESTLASSSGCAPTMAYIEAMAKQWEALHEGDALQALQLVESTILAVVGSCGRRLLEDPNDPYQVVVAAGDAGAVVRGPSSPAATKDTVISSSKESREPFGPDLAIEEKTALDRVSFTEPAAESRTTEIEKCETRKTATKDERTELRLEPNISIEGSKERTMKESALQASTTTALSRRVTWQELVYAVCWRRLYMDKVESAAMAAAATAFYFEHMESAAFIAAGYLSPNNSAATSAIERRQAEAFASFFPEEMDAWYAYNASLTEPFFGLERMDPACRCIPRHCGKCPASKNRGIVSRER